MQSDTVTFAVQVHPRSLCAGSARRNPPSRQLAPPVAILARARSMSGGGRERRGQPGRLSPRPPPIGWRGLSQEDGRPGGQPESNDNSHNRNANDGRNPKITFHTGSLPVGRSPLLVVALPKRGMPVQPRNGVHRIASSFGASTGPGSRPELVGWVLCGGAATALSGLPGASAGHV